MNGVAGRPALLRALIYEPLRHLQRPLPPLSPLFPAASTSSTRQVNNWSEREGRRERERAGGGRNFKECFFAVAEEEEATMKPMKNSALSRRPEAREEAVPIKKERIPPLRRKINLKV